MSVDYLLFCVIFSSMISIISHGNLWFLSNRVKDT
jgi:hypothetical protein